MRNIGRGLIGFGLIAVLLATLSAGASSAQSADDVVDPGESIQAAVNAAKPGDTIVVRGTHREYVVVRKNGIRLVGDDAVLRPGTGAPAQCGPAGICVLGDVDSQTGEVDRYVKNVRVTGFTVEGFEFTGIVTLGAQDARLTGNRTLRNDEYGFFDLSSKGTKITGNVARGSDDAGIYVGDSARSNAIVSGNETYDNFLGIFVRNARFGTLSSNRTHDNCMGILFLADAPGPAGNFVVKGNQILNNSKACAGSDEAPPISGAGIGLLGARGVKIEGNRISGNVPSGPTAYRGGVVVVRGIGGTAPVNNTVTGNAFGRNQPDIFWDETGSGNRFVRNDCDRSEPARLCN